MHASWANLEVRHASSIVSSPEPSDVSVGGLLKYQDLGRRHRLYELFGVYTVMVSIGPQHKL
jgi:hypothetical protein